MTRSHPVAITVVAAVVGAVALSGMTNSSTEAAAAALPCETPSTTDPTPKPQPPSNIRIIGDMLADLLWSDDENATTSGPYVPEGTEAEAGASAAADGNGYYESLASRGDCMAAYSLRDQGQIEQYRKSRSLPLDVNYLWPNDPDPRKQDAAKVVIGTSSNNLLTQVHLPVPDYGNQSLLITWDAWWGNEFRDEYSQLEDYKAFQLGSPGCSIWTETQARFKMARGTPYVAFTNIRQYGGLGPNTGYPEFNGRNYGNGKLGPLVGEFGVLAETWTRYWLFLEPDGDWYRLSMWLADRSRAPVRIYDRLQVNPKLPDRWECFRLEYNTSASGVADRGPLVSYARNVVMLRGVSSVSNLLQAPLD